MVIQLLQQGNDLKNRLITVILCAGEGIRFKKITKKIPKPLIKIKELNNSSILEHSINNLNKLGIKQIAIVKGHLGSKIDEFINSIKKEKPDLEKKIVIIDSGIQYKLGPLYSFLSITKVENIFNRNYIYMIIPGDTIFEINLLNQMVNIILNNFNLIQEYPLLFYRELKASTLKEQQESKIISIVDIAKKSQYCFLRLIKTCNLKQLSDYDLVRQIIPIFVFSFDFINEIIDSEKKISANSIREIFNYLIKEGREAIAFRIDKKYKFYDIDYKSDLNNLNYRLCKREKKKDNRSSDISKNHCFEGF
ncbi:MAG: hypothetical protein EU540_02360 [Promethearchaeota archaeon]|nr:MAG: hypothetical protein EU540_02360 [Candidatus Lokiarchaeota archaeon]